MSRTKLSRIPLIAMFSCFCVTLTVAQISEKKKPNIILVMTDDLGWGDTGFNGNKKIITPNIDKLASNGVILDRFYSASAVCSPTRASVMTGRNPYRTDVPHANQGHLKEGEITIAEILKEQGYATGHFGKWHLGTLTKKSRDGNRGGKPKNFQHYTIPTSHGYDEYFCSESKVPTYDPMIRPATFEKGESLHFGWKSVDDKESTNKYGSAYWVGNEKIDTTNLEGDDSKILMDRIIPFIQRSVDQEKPFFTTVWFHTPHLPVVSDKAHRERYSSLNLREQIYFGTITAMDEQMGRLWLMLESLNIDEETIIMFCSDNGPEKKTPGSASIFRQRKRSLYEGGVRVPAFAIWKGHIKGGQRLEFPSVTSDYLPTILDILNIEFPDKRPIDGESIWPVLTENKKMRDRPIGFLFANKQSWVNNQYKLISVDGGESFELYDLLNDKSEKENIIKKEPEIASVMKQDLKKWMKSVTNSKMGKDYSY